MSAIKELNYHPDISARSFKTGKKYTVGLIVPNIGSGFFASFIEDTEAILQQKKYTSGMLWLRASHGNSFWNR